jgi:hypothetical protein
MSLSLLTLNNDVMRILLKNIDKESLLILGLVSKELYKTLKELNPGEKLTASLKYLTSSLSLLKYAYKNGCPLNPVTIKKILNVTNNESLECLKYSYKNGYSLNEETFSHAASGGHIDVLNWLQAKKCMWNKETCNHAAKKGHLECLKYLHENGCPWDELTCRDSARNGHLECLKYARDNGCPE